MNVMITRPICLLIVIGNHTALNSDPNWAQFIDYCHKNDALVRKDRLLHKRIIAP